MRLSVIIPAHNAAAFLADALESVAAQTLRPHEVFVVDDCSSDRTADIARSFVGLPIQVLSSDARNAAETRNIGIRAASGDWIALLDADDIWEPRHLEWSAEILRRGSDVAMMSNHIWLTEAAGRHPIPEGLRPKIGETLTGLPSRRFVDELGRQIHFGHSTVIYRRDRLLDAGLFDAQQKRRHDIELWLRVIDGHTWAWDERIHSAYREDSPGSISKAIAECEVYYLRALQRHQAAYAGDAMDILLRTHSRRAMSLSFVDGRPELFREAQAIGSRHVPAFFRLTLGAAAIYPEPLRAAIRLKRKWVWRHR